MTASFRVDPGLAVEMIQAIGVEKDPFALFSIGLDQTTATDVRRLAANRLNDLSSMDVLNYIRTAADHEVLEGICRSNLFPTTYKSFARAALGRPEPRKPKPKYYGEGRWIKAMFPGKCTDCGVSIVANQRAYYYKESRTVLCEEGCGKRAARRAA